MALKDILKTKKASAKNVSAKETSASKKTSENAVGASSSARGSHAILRRPHITEKATLLSSQNIYTFEVAPHANKTEIRRAVQEIYGVTPIRVGVVNIPKRRVIVRGKKGSRAALRKAYITLKHGDMIEFA